MIAVLGISHKSAPVSVRELYSFDEKDKIDFYLKIQAGLFIEGMVILSTCNRTELYINTILDNSNEVFSGLVRELNDFKKICIHDPGIFYFFTGEEAIKQIFKVSSGIESLVLGEDQILGQVKDAFRNAQTSNLTDCILSRLFIKAIEAGKRVRTETQLSKGAASISYATVELCRELFPDLKKCKIMMVGAGQTSDLLLQCLLKKESPQFVIANRTYAKAASLAEKYGGTAVKLSDIDSELADCDIIIAATSSKEHLITKELVEKVRAHNKEKKQVYIDISVPSNIAENVKELDNVKYFCIDDLRSGIIKNLERRKSAIDHSMSIIYEVQNELMEWINSQNLIPAIMSIKENLRNIHQTELEGFLKYRKIQESELIEHYSEYISEKYTENFIKKLKQVTNNGRNPEHIRIINDLFT